ncbi:MalY/PatB family protein [Pectinatus haikarae]|uniref:cysteine-S-conjugate beta-lyase n=1 Tax=Pectinatus haikarae TaxID=349096 RepID=A0ABT9Y6C0_9FIRM|nr:MalY/PatB family protein [Pectinatus haikarae]MDQ0203259.1 putative C-S lyase [Pectinatus haikarae]
MYDFSSCPDRENSGSAKWAAMKKVAPQISSDIIPLSVADMELPTAPEIISGLQDYLSGAVLGYTIPTNEYLQAVCGWMLRRHEFEISPEWIVSSPGVVPAIFNSIRSYTKKGDGVIVMTPVYYPFYRAITENKRRIVKNPLLHTGSTYHINFDDLEQKARSEQNKLLILCSPHNPVGRIWTNEELQRVADICLKNNVLVIADEIHSDIIMPGHRHTVFATLSEDAADNCLICTAPSKTFNLAGLQVSNIIIKNDLIRRKFIKTAVKAGYGTLNVLGYKACEIAYTKCEAWLEQLLKLIDGNRKLCENFMEKNIPQIKITKLEGTYLQWWDCRKLNMEKNELESFMTKKASLFFDEGYIFGKEGEGYERINLACPAKALDSALLRLKNALSVKSK